MTRYLVTGGAGFIGRALCARLADEGHAITVLDDLSSGDASGLPEGARLIRADICDKPALAEALEGTAGIFHLAAISSVEECTARRAETNRTNLLGTVTLLELSEARPVVYSSSAAVYGAQSALPISEAAPPDPISPYAVDKLASERHLAVAASLRGARGVALRLFNVYGPGQPPRSPYAGVITRFVARASAGHPIVIHGDGGQTRDFIHVEDVSRALEAAMALAQSAGPGFFERINICSGIPLTILELAGTVERLTGSAAARDYQPARPGDIRLSLGDPTEARQRLGFVAGRTLEDGLAQLLGSEAPKRRPAHLRSL